MSQMPRWQYPPPFGITVEADVPLAPLTTMRVGGPAELLAKVTTTEELCSLVQWAQAESLPYLILGGGSNILVSDSGVRGLVIQNRCRQIEVTRLSAEENQKVPIGWDRQPACKADKREGRQENGERNPDQAAPDHSVGATLFAESGAAMAGAARTSVRSNLTGLEWAVSVPGTIGGAIVNNAGAHGGEIKDNLIVADIIDGCGQRKKIPVEELAYTYRRSSLKSKARPYRASFGPVVLSGMFQLAAAAEDEVNRRADEFLSHRRRTQPVEPSLGSMFMNPEGDFAGRLIEAAGLKGTQVGQIQVSMQHANFIVNPNGVGAGKASDVINLIELIQEKVAAQFEVHLQPEVQLVGEWE